MTDENMIERVAAAIGATFAEEQERLVDAAMAADGSLTGIADEMMAKCARAAIEAMRQPTADMAQAGFASDAFRTPMLRLETDFEPKAVYRAMIDAALVTTPSKL